MPRVSPPEHAKDHKYEIKKGLDGKKFMSKPDKNGVFKWVNLPSDYPDIEPYENGIVEIAPLQKSKDHGYIYVSILVEPKIYIWERKTISLHDSAEEFYKQFPGYTVPKYDLSIITSKFTELEKMLQKINIYFFFIKWHQWSPTPFEIEYWLEDNSDKLEGKEYIYISERRLFWDCRENNGIAFFSHSIKKESRNDVNKILSSLYPKRTSGINTFADSLKIYFNEQKKIEKDVEKIRVSIDFKFKKIDLTISQFIEALDGHVKQFGYVDQYDNGFSKNMLNVCLNIRHDKIAEFKQHMRRFMQSKVSMSIDVWDDE